MTLNAYTMGQCKQYILASVVISSINDFKGQCLNTFKFCLSSLFCCQYNEFDLVFIHYYLLLFFFI